MHIVYTYVCRYSAMHAWCMMYNVCKYVSHKYVCCPRPRKFPQHPPFSKANNYIPHNALCLPAGQMANVDIGFGHSNQLYLYAVGEGLLLLTEISHCWAAIMTG